MTRSQKSLGGFAAALSARRESPFYSLWQPIEEWKGGFLFVRLRDIEEPKVQAAIGVLSPCRRCDPELHPRLLALLSQLPIWPVADREVSLLDAHAVRWLRVGFHRVSSRLVLEQPGRRPVNDYEDNLPHPSSGSQAAWIDDMIQAYTDGEINAEIVRGTLALHRQFQDCRWGQKDHDLHESLMSKLPQMQYLLWDVELTEWEQHLKRIEYTTS